MNTEKDVKVQQLASAFFKEVEGESAELIFQSLLFMSTTFFMKMETLQVDAGVELHKLFARAINSDVKRYVERQNEIQKSGGSREGKPGEAGETGQGEAEGVSEAVQRNEDEV